MPQPIDTQTELGRITAAERIAQISDRASLAAQARAAQEAELERKAVENEIREAKQKNEQVDKELRRNAPFVGKRGKKKQDEQTDKEDKHASHHAGERPVIPTESDIHGLDISI